MKLNLQKKKDDTPIEPWLDQEFLKTQPKVFPKNLSKGELHQRLHGGLKVGNVVSEGIKGYNRTMIAHGMPHHCTTERALKIALAASGFDWRLAVGVGINSPSAGQD